LPGILRERSANERKINVSTPSPSLRRDTLKHIVTRSAAFFCRINSKSCMWRIFALNFVIKSLSGQKLAYIMVKE
jgi:hypothetical protein